MKHFHCIFWGGCDKDEADRVMPEFDSKVQVLRKIFEGPLVGAGFQMIFVSCSPWKLGAEKKNNSKKKHVSQGETN